MKSVLCVVVGSLLMLACANDSIKSYSTTDFVKVYNEKSGSESLTGKQVKLTGLVEAITSFKSTSGGKKATLCFDKQDGFMKYGVVAHFPEDKKDELELFNGKTVTITGIVDEKQFGAVVIKNSVINKE